MNIYRLALAHVRLLLGITGTGVLVTIIVEQYTGHSTIPFALTALVLLLANRRLGQFNCPRCNSNLFVRERIALPWPNRTCSQCGLDLDHRRR